MNNEVSKLQIASGIYNIKDSVSRSKFYYGYSTKNYAHRGLSSEAPENTIASVTKAGYHGCYGVEIDVNATFDGKIVVMHDTTVDRMTNGTGTINDLTSSYIESLIIDSGNCLNEYPTQHVPYLEEILEICNQFNMHPMIELKGEWNTTTYDNLLYLLRLYNIIDRTTIISFDINNLIDIRNKDKDVLLAYLYDSELTDEIINLVNSIGKCGLSLNYLNNSSMSDEMRLNMFEKKIQLGFWTVDNKTYVKSLEKNGTSFIVSNYGYGGPIKEYTKKIILEGGSSVGDIGISIWQKIIPDTNIGSYYDSAEITYDSTTKEYTLTYKTPFPSVISLIYSTIVNVNLETGYKYKYSVYARGQNNNGFIFYLIDNTTGQRISGLDIQDFYINISINGY